MSWASSGPSSLPCQSTQSQHSNSGFNSGYWNSSNSSSPQMSCASSTSSAAWGEMIDSVIMDEIKDACNTSSFSRRGSLALMPRS